MQENPQKRPIKIPPPTLPPHHNHRRPIHIFLNQIIHHPKTLHLHISRNIIPLKAFPQLSVQRNQGGKFARISSIRISVGWVCYLDNADFGRFVLLHYHELNDLAAGEEARDEGVAI